MIIMKRHNREKKHRFTERRLWARRVKHLSQKKNSELDVEGWGWVG